MATSMGERLRPLPARDARGRFVSASPRLEDLLQPLDVEDLLDQFDVYTKCQFPDPWRPNGWYVIETRRSLKGYPVAMRYEGYLLKKRAGTNCVIKYDGFGWADCPNGEVAVSLATWYGDPGDAWEQQDLRHHHRQMAAIYLHLATSVDLHRKQCGDVIGVLDSGSRRRYDGGRYEYDQEYDPDEDEDGNGYDP
jgi:hypothetical protein